MRRFVPDSTLYIPTGCGAPSGISGLRSFGFTGYGQKIKQAALYADTCGHHIYWFHWPDSTWKQIDGSSGSITTDSLTPTFIPYWDVLGYLKNSPLSTSEGLVAIRGNTVLYFGGVGPHGSSYASFADTAGIQVYNIGEQTAITGSGTPQDMLFFQGITTGKTHFNQGGTDNLTISNGSIRPFVGTAATRTASPSPGDVYWDTDTLCLVAYNGSVWHSLCSAGGGGSTDTTNLSYRIDTLAANVDTTVFSKIGTGVDPYTNVIAGHTNTLTFPRIRDTSAAAKQIAGDGGLTIATHDSTSGNALQTRAQADTAKQNLRNSIAAKVANAGGAPSILEDVFASRPAAGTAGRIFIATDTKVQYRDNGSSWDLIGAASGISQIKAGPSPYVKVVGTDSVRLVMDSVANSLGFSPTPFVNSWLYSYDNFWTTTTSNGYTNTGLTLALSGNKVSLTGSGNNYSQQYTKTQQSYYEHWMREDTVVINNTISATTYGIGNGVNTQSNIGWVDLSTGGNAGKAFIVTNGTIQATSAGAITFANGDTIVLKMQRARDTLTFTVANRANATTQTVSRIVATAFQVSSTDLIHKIGQFGLFVKGGTYILTGSRTTIQEQQQPPLVLFGDSKFQGFYVTNWNDRISDRLNAVGIRTINMGSSGDNYANFLARIADVIQMHPQQVILETSNDLRQGVALPQAITNYESLKGILEAAGIKVWVLTSPETGSFAGVMAQFDSAMKQMHPLEYIGAYAKVVAGGAPCLAADGVHWTSIGNDSVTKAIIASVKINNPLYVPNQNIYSPYTTEAAKTFHNQAAIGGNNSFTGATSSFKLGTTGTAAFDLQTGSRMTRLNWTNALPRMVFYNSASGIDGIFHLDSLGNVGIGKGLYSSAQPTSSNSVIIGNSAAAFAVAAGTGNAVIIGPFANGGVTNQTVTSGVMIGQQAGYYENTANKFYISAGNTQNLLYGDFATGRLRVNPGTNGTSPLTMAASAQFQVSSTTRGILMADMTTAQRTAISSPATGLHVTNTDSAGRMEFYDGSAWQLYADRNWVRANFGLTANPLSQFAATTSAQLAGVLSDETGSGAAVFANSPTFTGTVVIPGMVSSVAGNDLTSQTAYGTITTYAVPADGVYEVSGYVIVNSITTNQIKLTVNFTDHNNTGRALDMFPSGTTTALTSLTGYYAYVTMTIKAKSGTNIVIASDGTTGGSINFDAGATIKKIR